MSLCTPSAPSAPTITLGTRKSDTPARAGRRARRARENHVDDVLGHVVVAVRDEDLGSLQAVMIAVSHGARGQRADVPSRPAARSCTWRPTIRPTPAWPDRPPSGRRSHARRAGRWRSGSTAGTARRTCWPRPTSRRARWPRRGQPLAVVCRVGGDAVPATRDEPAIGVGEAVGHAHDVVREARAGQIARPVERRQHAAGKLGGLVEHAVDVAGLKRAVAAEPGQRGGVDQSCSTKRMSASGAS